jgi:hypothetical protein
MSAIAAEVRQFGTSINETLELVDELRTAVRTLRERREALRARVVAAMPIRNESSFARHARVQRVQTALDRMLQPLREIELQPGKELTEHEITTVATEIAATAKE